MRRLWLGRGYLHWDAGRVRFPDLIATTPFWDEIWFAKVQNEGVEVASEERLGYGYGTFDGLLGLGLSDGYR